MKKRKEIKKLLRKYGDQLKEKIPLKEFLHLQSTYYNRNYNPPEGMMRHDLRYIKECLGLSK